MISTTLQAKMRIRSMLCGASWIDGGFWWCIDWMDLKISYLGNWGADNAQAGTKPHVVMEVEESQPNEVDH